MYRGFNLDLSKSDLSRYEASGKSLHDKNKEDVKTKLDSFKDKNGNLIASEIVANWFPSIQADIFLSHSHKDSKDILGFAGWLYDELGLTSFIDSSIWGYSADLLNIIDKAYCWQEDSETYNYQKRNRSTSHVYMMLSTALTKMIDRCECVFFANTPHSISPKTYIDEDDKTASPWIYSEICMTSLVRKRSPDEHRRMMVKSSVAMDSFTESLEIQYDVDLNHLTPMDHSDLVSWITAWSKNRTHGSSALDKLYQLKAHHG